MQKWIEKMLLTTFLWILTSVKSLVRTMPAKRKESDIEVSSCVESLRAYMKVSVVDKFAWMFLRRWL